MDAKAFGGNGDDVPGYDEFVGALCKKGCDIIGEMTADQAHLLHMAVGVSGEAGELLDAIKKYAIYQKPLDDENVVEELGDLVFYMVGIMIKLGITWADVIDNNRAKLNARYHKLTYSNEQAQERADKKGGE